jgi:hypothetical protein
VIAQVQPDGSLSLAFATLPSDQPTTFTDVVRLTGLTNERAQLSVTLTGAHDTSCVSAGIWDAERDRFARDEVLAGGSTRSLAVSFEPTRATEPGSRTMTLIVVARLEDGRTQQTTYPVTLTWTRAVPDPATSPTSELCAPSPSGSPRSYPSATPTAARRGGSAAWASLWRLPFLALTRTAWMAVD